MLKRIHLEAVLFVAAFFVCLHRPMAPAPVDYYEFWSAAEAVTHWHVPNVYAPDAGVEINHHFRRDSEKALRNSASHWNSPEFTGTPMLYGAIGLVSTGDFALDYQIFCCVKFAVFIGAILALARALRLGIGPTAGFLALFVLASQPFVYDGDVGNVSSFQFAALAAFMIVILSWMRWKWLVGGLILGSACMLKPTLVFATGFAFLGAALTSRRAAMEYAGGVLAAMAVQWGWSTAYFGSWRDWAEGYTQFHSTGGYRRNLLRRIGNMHDASPDQLLIWTGLLALPQLVLAARSYMADRSDPTAGPLRACFLAQAGALVFILGGHIVHSHYFLFLLPTCFFLARPPLDETTLRERRVLFGLAVIGAVLICFPGPEYLNDFMLGMLGAAVLYAGLLWLQYRLRPVPAPAETAGGEAPLLVQAAWVSGWTIVGRAAGLAVPLLIGYWFGAVESTDVFFLAFTLLAYFIMVFGDAVRFALSPYLAERLRDGDASSFLDSVLLLSGVAVTLLFPAVVAVFVVAAHRFDLLADAHRGRFLWMMAAGFPFVLGGVWAQHLSAYLNVKRRFALAAFSPVARGVVAAASVFVAHKARALVIVVAGYAVGEAATFALVIAGVVRAGYRPRLGRAGVAASLSFFRTVGFQIAGVAVLLWNSIVDKAVAARLTPGDVTLAHYSTVFHGVLVNAFAVPLGIVVVSNWALARSRDALPFNSIMSETRKATLAAVAACVVMVFFRGSLTQIIFAHGVFPREDLPVLADLCLYQTIALVPLLPYTVLSRALIVERRTGILLGVCCLQFVLNFVGDLALTRHMGVSGLPLSSAIHMAVATVVLWLAVRAVWRAVPAAPGEAIA